MRMGSKCRSALPAILTSSLLAFVCFALMSVSGRAAEGSAPASVPGAPTFVPLDPIFVSVIQSKGGTRQIGMTLVLELASERSKTDVEAKRKLLTDAFFRELYGFFQQRSSSQPLDERYLKRRLVAAANQIVGSDVVSEVLIEQFFERGR